MDSTINLPQRTEVAIVGAGPTGLALAVTLASAGVDFVVLDRLAEGANTSRAAVVHARTLEVLRRAGRRRGTDRARHPGHPVRGPRRLPPAADRAVRQAAHAVPVHADGPPVRDRERAAGPAAGARRRRPPPLRGHVGGPGRGRRQAHHEHRGHLRAGYAVGADGMHSAVREAAASGSPAAPTPSPSSSPTSLMDWAPGRSEVSLTFGTAGLTVVAPLPGGHYRVVATVGRRTGRTPTSRSSNGCWTSAPPARPGHRPGLVLPLPRAPPGRRPLPGRPSVPRRRRRPRAQPRRRPGHEHRHPGRLRPRPGVRHRTARRLRGTASPRRPAGGRLHRPDDPDRHHPQPRRPAALATSRFPCSAAPACPRSSPPNSPSSTTGSAGTEAGPR